MSDRSFEIDGRESWLVMQAGVGIVAFPASAVSEVGELGLVTRLPHVPSYVLGLTSSRGDPLPVVDLARFLELTELEGEAKAMRLATIDYPPYRVGFLGLRIFGVVQAGIEEKHEASLVRGGRLMEFSVAELRTSHGIAAILDLDRVLDAARVRA